MPPEPEQVRVKVVPAVSAPVDCVPVVALVPVHPPEAVQLVELVELQVSVDELPLVTVTGFAASVMVGAGEVTVTVAD